MVDRRGPVYDDYEDIFHRHYEEHYKNAQHPVERYEIGYNYGFNLARPQQPDKWIEVEEEARRGWEEEGVGPWEDFKGAIQHAWETAKDAMGG
jgi:hypothetical protein